MVFFEIDAADDGALATFYASVFGWARLGVPTGGPIMIDTCGGGGINGGIGRTGIGVPWSAFCVETDDVQATLDKATSLGGRTVMPATDVGSMSMAVFRDLDGLPVGLVSASAAPLGRGPSAGSGDAVDWFEVIGSDAERTQDFYAGLFEWTIDRSFPGYGVVDPGSSGGIWGGVGGGVDQQWATVYAAVADVDATLRRVEKLGARLVAAPAVDALKYAARVARYGAADDISTGLFRDPAGNTFGVYQKSGA